MTTSYRPVQPTTAATTLERLREAGVVEFQVEGETNYRFRCLTDGQNYLWLEIDASGFAATLTAYEGNDGGRIIALFTERLGVDVMSDREPEFWGFATREEWKESRKREAREREEARESDNARMEAEILKFLRREPSELLGRDHGLLKHAAIAAIENPSLLEPGKEKRFWKSVLAKCAHLSVLSVNEKSFRRRATRLMGEMEKRESILAACGRIEAACRQ